MLGKISRFFVGLGNLIAYRKVIYNDRDTDYFFILELLNTKLKRVAQYWGSLSNYENDYHDKEKLLELIKEIEDFQKRSFDQTENINKKECSTLMQKVGRLIPNLWLDHE